MKLNPNEIKIKYPKSVEKLKEYLTPGYAEANVPKELQDQINLDQLVNLTIIGTRGLYDFLDEYGLYINTGVHGGSWGFGVGELDEDLPEMNMGFATRLEAEQSAIMTAFEELEKRLNNEQN